MVQVIKSEISIVKHKFADVRNQYIAFIIVNLMTIGHGATTGWLSPITHILQSDASPFDSGPMTNEQMSWLGSIVMLGGLIGNFSYSLINNYFGIKVSILTLGIPNIISWIIVILAPSIDYLYASRLLGGISGGGVTVCIPLFIAEVASDHVRGSLGSFFSLSIHIGVMFSFVTGPYVPYHILPFVIITLPILFTIGVTFLPDVPSYLLKCGKIKEAEKSVRFYKNCKQNSKGHNERFEIEMEKVVKFSNKMTQNEKITLKDFCTPEARRGLLIVFSVVILNTLTGTFPTFVYAHTVFSECGSDFDPNLSAIIMIGSQLAGMYVCIFTADRVGRKNLMIVSHIGGTVGMFFMGLYVSFTKGGVFNMSSFYWLPVTSLSVAFFCLGLGLLSLTFTIVAEVMPSKIRPIGASLSMIQMSITLFVLGKFFPIVYPIIGLDCCMWFYALVSFMGVLFSIFVLPETNGKNINS